MDKEDVCNRRDDIVLAILPHVAFDGWTWEGVRDAAREKNYDDGVLRAVFPDRLTDVLDAFSDLADRKMLEALAGTDPEALRIRDRVREALMARYRFLSPYKEAMRKSLAYWFMPLRKPRAARIVWRTADCIWGWAGDTAKDYNRYTKRSLLSGIIVSTTLAWLNDDDENLSGTQAFLDRRIENVMQLNKILGKAKARS